MCEMVANDDGWTRGLIYAEAEGEDTSSILPFLMPEGWERACFIPSSSWMEEKLLLGEEVLPKTGRRRGDNKK